MALHLPVVRKTQRTAGSLQAPPCGSTPDFNAMTPDELQRLVVAGASGPLVDALAPLDEAARRMLAKRAFELFQAANDFERKTDLSKLMGDAGNAASRNAELAVLACCDGTKAKRIQQI